VAVAFNEPHGAYDLEQSNAICARLDDLTEGVAALLDHFGKSMLGDNSNGNNVRKKTIQQQVDTVLSTHQNETQELVITSVMETNGSATPAKILFQPSHSEIEKIKLRRSKLAFSDGNLHDPECPKTKSEHHPEMGDSLSTLQCVVANIVARH